MVVRVAGGHPASVTTNPTLRQLARDLELVAFVMLAATAVSLLAGCPAWRPVGALAALVSIAVLLPSVPITPAGLLVDAAVLIAVAAAHRRPRWLDAGGLR